MGHHLVRISQNKHKLEIQPKIGCQQPNMLIEPAIMISWSRSKWGNFGHRGGVPPAFGRRTPKTCGESSVDGSKIAQMSSLWTTKWLNVYDLSFSTTVFVDSDERDFFRFEPKKDSALTLVSLYLLFSLDSSSSGALCYREIIPGGKIKTENSPWLTGKSPN